ncbi:MAG: hypothetical protein WB630_04545, partial [Candidatus Acidiferrales bacterium]
MTVVARAAVRSLILSGAAFHNELTLLRLLFVVSLLDNPPERRHPDCPLESSLVVSSIALTAWGPTYTHRGEEFCSNNFGWRFGLWWSQWC